MIALNSLQKIVVNHVLCCRTYSKCFLPDSWLRNLFYVGANCMIVLFNFVQNILRIVLFLSNNCRCYCIWLRIVLNKRAKQNNTAVVRIIYKQAEYIIFFIPKSIQSDITKISMYFETKHVYSVILLQEVFQEVEGVFDKVSWHVLLCIHLYTPVYTWSSIWAWIRGIYVLGKKSWFF